MWPLIHSGLPDVGAKNLRTGETVPTEGLIHPAQIDQLVFDGDAPPFELDPAYFTQDVLYLAAPKFRTRPGSESWLRTGASLSPSPPPLPSLQRSIHPHALP